MTTTETQQLLLDGDGVADDKVCDSDLLLHCYAPQLYYVGRASSVQHKKHVPRYSLNDCQMLLVHMRLTDRLTCPNGWDCVLVTYTNQKIMSVIRWWTDAMSELGTELLKSSNLLLFA